MNSEEILKAFKNAAGADFYRGKANRFFKEFLPDITMYNWYKEPEKLIEREKYILILAPPGSGKTRRFTIGETVRRIALNRNERIGIFSKSQDKAKNYMTAIRKILKRPSMEKEFGRFIDRETVANTQQIRVIGAIGDESTPSISNMGITGQAESLRLTTIIIDDGVDLETATSETEVEKFIRRMAYTFIPRLEPGGQMIVIGSRFGERDGYDWVLANRLFENGIFILPAIRDGQSTIPERYSTEQLLRIKTGMEADEELGTLTASMWETRYQQNPTSKRKVFGEGIRWTEKYARNAIMVVDPAYSGEGGDYTAMVVMGLAENGQDIIVEDIKIERIAIGHAEKIKAMWQAGRAGRVIVETNNARTLGNECRRKGIPVQDWISKGKKEERIGRLSVWFSRPEGAGAMLFRRSIAGTDAHRELIKEMAFFPNAAHDDVLDALATGMEILKMHGSPSLIFR